LAQEGVTISDDVREVEARCHEQGAPLIVVAVDDALAGAIELKASIPYGYP
jgi:hypothetical protein